MFAPETFSGIRRILSFAFAALLIVSMFRIALDGFQTGPWYAGAFFLALAALFLFWTGQAVLAWHREWQGREKYPLAAILLFVGFVAIMATQIWSDVTRPQRFQESERLDKVRRDNEEREWALKHPQEAAALSAKFERMLAATERQLRIPAECSSRTGTFEAYENCVALAKRAEAMRCLQGPDWKDCAEIK